MEAKNTFQRFTIVTSVIVFLYSAAYMYAHSYSVLYPVLCGVGMVIFVFVGFSALFVWLAATSWLEELFFERWIFPALGHVLKIVKVLWGQYKGK